MPRTTNVNLDTINLDTRLPDIRVQQKQTPDRNLAMSGTVFPIPLSKRKQAAIAFETLPVEKKDIEAIKKWLELFEESLTEDNEV